MLNVLLASSRLVWRLGWGRAAVTGWLTHWITPKKETKLMKKWCKMVSGVDQNTNHLTNSQLDYSFLWLNRYFLVNYPLTNRLKPWCVTTDSVMSCRREGVYREEGSADPSGNWDGLCGVEALQRVCLQQSQHQGNVWLRRKLQHMSAEELLFPRQHSCYPLSSTHKDWEPQWWRFCFFAWAEEIWDVTSLCSRHSSPYWPLAYVCLRSLAILLF